MNQDAISALREAQRTLAESLAVPLWARIGLTIAVEPARLEEFLDPIVATEGMKLEPDALRIMYEREIPHQLYKAVLGYTDWVAVRIVRSDNYELQDLPVPSIVDALTITAEYDVKQGVLGFVVERLKWEACVPLLGQVEAGTLTPDAAAIKEWASFYDLDEMLVP